VVERPRLNGTILDQQQTSLRGAAQAEVSGGASVTVSVVTVCFNSAKTIARTLESFFAQEHPAKELVIIDGDSSDETLQIVASFPSEGVVVISEPDRGIYDAMNKGLAAFTGDAVGFLNSDDRFKDAHALGAVAETLAGCDIAFGDLDIVRCHERGEIVRRWRTAPWRKGAFRQGWMPAHPTFYCKREVIEAVGPFDLRYRVAADYDHMLRAMELHDFRAAPVGRVLVDMLHGGESTSSFRSHLHHNLEALDSRRRWLGARAIDYALFAKPLRKLPQWMRAKGRLSA
jgi:glycosyltransferase involved in cell wall biosynthesis